MIKDLFVLHDDNSVFNNVSSSMRDYLRDEEAVTFVTLEDFIYIGLYKPFNQVYVELTTPQIEGAVLSYEYSKTASFSALEVDDDTKDFARSGFVTWDREQTDWALQTIDGLELYWVRVSSDIDFTVTLKGLNILFADDNDMLADSPRVMKYLPKGETSFVNYHVAARNDIIQTIRNGGLAKKDISNSLGNLSNLTAWDILEAGEIREAAKFLALAKMYFDNSVNNDDKEYSKFRDNIDFYSKAFNLFLLSLDFNDDGKEDKTEEQAQMNTIGVYKV